MRDGQESFGARMRRAREARGLSIECIAKTTKIKASLLVGLERNDISQWPAGLFRRAFLREYAAAIGLSPEQTVAEFVRVYPEPGQVAPLEPTEADGSGGGLRLTLAESSPLTTLRTSTSRVVAALVDASVIVATGSAAAALSGANLWAAVAVFGLCYSSAATLFAGGSPAARALARLYRAKNQRTRLRQDPAAFDIRELLPLTPSHPASQVWRPQ